MMNVASVVISDIEKKLTEICETDPSSEELYENLRILAAKLLISRRIASNASEVDEMSHDLAALVYLKVRNGKEIKFWAAYMGRALQSELSRYLRVSTKQIFEVGDKLNKKEFIERYYNQALVFNQQQDTIEATEVLKTLSNILDDVFSTTCRYTKDHPNYINLKISVYLSLAHKKIVYFNIRDDYEKQYVDVLVKLTKRQIFVELGKILHNSDYIDLLERDYFEEKLK